MSINFAQRHLLTRDGQEWDFLGTMGGWQASRQDSQPTYSRLYTRFGGTDMIRDQIFRAINSPETIQEIGDRYSFTPWRLRDGRAFGQLDATWQGGGFFLTLKKLDVRDRHITSMQYAISVLGHQLAAISGLSVEEISRQCAAYGLDYMLKYFFESIDLPQDGDLVVYPGTRDAPPQYGIFRESEPNWNSPHGGTVESKMYWNSCDIVQHDLFFVSSSYGNKARFYRVKSEQVKIDSLTIQPHPIDPSLRAPSLHSNALYKVEEDGSLNRRRTEEALARSCIIDSNSGGHLSRLLPEIEHLPYIKFFGLCHHYAFARILSTHSTSTLPELEAYGSKILKKYFSVTRAPQKGDLVVYYSGLGITHWGIYLGEGRVESKWGTESVYRHPLFDASSRYGGTIRCFRLKDGLTAQTLALHLEQDQQSLKRLEEPLEVAEEKEE